MKFIQMIQITPEQLQEEYLKVTRKLFSEFKKELKPRETEEYLKVSEVANLFKVDPSTIHNWTKKGKLKSYGFKGSSLIYYKRSEIEQCLIQIS